MAEGDALRLRIDDNAIKAVTVAINASTSGTSSADPELVGGRIIGWYPVLSGTKGLVSIAIGSTGIVTVTIDASDTATYVVNVLKSNA